MIITMGEISPRQQHLWFRPEEIRQDGFGETEEMTGRRTKTKIRQQTFELQFLIFSHKDRKLFHVLVEFVVVNEVPEN